MKPVTSSAIEAIGYDPATRDLDVQYKGGGSYTFHDVAPELYAKLLSSKSIGSAVNEHVKGKHRHTKG